METEHIVSEPVRAYLLGQIEGAEAVALEEKYFMDRSFFLRVQAVEKGLIEEYLENRLPKSERQQFESRYLKIPALRQRLEEVRAEWAVSRPAPKSASWWAWRAAFAACVIGAVGIAWIYVHEHRARSEAVTQAKHAQEEKVLTIRLGDSIKGSRSNGLGNMGPREGRRIEFQLPPMGGSIRFSAYLIRETSTVFCTPEISMINADESRTKIWSSDEAVASVPANGGQELTVAVDSSVFHPGGAYALKLVRPDGTFDEFQRFHVTGPR